MIQKLKLLLVDPQSFFKDENIGNGNLRPPAMILLAIGIISGIGGAMIAGITFRILPSEAQSFATVGIGAGFIGAIIGIFIMWVVFSGVFYLISMAFKGTGDFKRTMECVGYGYSPQIIGSLISLPLIAYFTATVQVPQVTDPMMIEPAITALMRNPIMQLAQIVGILFLIWSANIWVFGMKHARGLSTRDAAITVGIPVGILVIYTAYSLFG